MTVITDRPPQRPSKPPIFEKRSGHSVFGYCIFSRTTQSLKYTFNLKEPKNWEGYKCCEIMWNHLETHVSNTLETVHLLGCNTTLWHKRQVIFMISEKTTSLPKPSMCLPGIITLVAEVACINMITITLTERNSDVSISLQFLAQFWVAASPNHWPFPVTLHSIVYPALSYSLHTPYQLCLHTCHIITL